MSGTTVTERDDLRSSIREVLDRSVGDAAGTETTGDERAYDSGLWSRLAELGVRLPPPRLGEHDDFVYARLLGLSTAEIEALRRE